MIVNFINLTQNEELEVNETVSVNPSESPIEESTSDTSNEDEPEKESASAAMPSAPSVPLFGHRFGVIDMIAFVLSASLIVLSQVFSTSILRWILSGSAIAVLLLPGVIQRIQMKNAFGIGAIYARFKKMNLNPEIEGNEIRWKVGEIIHVLRVFGRGQIQFCREYPANPANSKAFAAAANATMSQIFSAKVGVKDEGENIFFATEMLCSSIKEFDKLFPACESILDAAEERQRVNFKEVMEANKGPQRKIGFVQQYTLRSEEPIK